MRVPVHQGQQTGDSTLDRMQNNVRALFSALRLVPFLFNGRLVSVSFLATTPKAVTHNLGGPAGYIVVRNNYNGSGVGALIGENAASFQNALDQKKQISLYASVACTVDLWFYPQASQRVPQ